MTTPPSASCWNARWLARSCQCARLPARTRSSPPSTRARSPRCWSPTSACRSGIALLADVKRRLPGVPVIIMTAHTDLDSAVGAFQGGAFEYLPKPFDVEKAVELIRRAASESLREEGAATEASDWPRMLGQAPAMQEVFRAIGRLSQSDATVLITGASGTGKELVAHALHRHSPRADGPFVAINAAAIPKDLLESELFGHERGAFTGAQAMRRGRFEQAAGGTLFLDEIGDMPLELQTRLLRVLSDGHFYRVGGHQPQRAEARVIAATHQNLAEHVRQGTFREDLYHRLNVIRLHLPPLRERREDIPLLTRFFLARGARELGVEPKHISDAALERLSRFDFPGNVRQLENLCRWLTVMAPGQRVELEDLPPDVAGADAHPARSATGDAAAAVDWSVALGQQARDWLQAGDAQVWERLAGQFETVLLRTALQLTQGRRAEAAQKLGIGRNTLTRKIQELGLDD